MSLRAELRVIVIAHPVLPHKSRARTSTKFQVPSTKYRVRTHLVLEYDEREDLEAHVDAEQLQRKVQWEVDEREPRVVRQGERQRAVQVRRQQLDLRGEEAQVTGSG